jgi:hypothetical protein
LIEAESVRRMFRAKLAMNAIVVQLLVDSSPDKFKRDKIADQNKWRLFKLIIRSLSQRTKFLNKVLLAEGCYPADILTKTLQL